MDDARRRRARMRAWRRGFREADLLLGQFADARLAGMSAAELDQFEQLLEADDHDLYAWIVGATAAPDEFDTPVLAELRRSIQAAPASDKR